MASVRKQYPFDLIESKWRDRWLSRRVFKAWNPGESIPEDHPFALRHGTGGDLPPKYYALDMFPYPSGAGLHVGHPEGYTATDIVSRYKRAKGFNVLHPIGWDAFGLPAEQYAIKTGQHPRITTEANVTNFRRQIQALGFSYDWDREVNTTDPDYFRWTQWIFLQLYNAWFNPETRRAEPIDTLPIPEELTSDADIRRFRDGKRLAFVSEAPVNWCPELGTVLANEEVVDGKSEVGGFDVIRKPMRQWMLRITAFGDRLLEDLETLNWPTSLKEMQRNWIGRSEGAEVQFSIVDSERSLTVFTTRPDTLFGATYMVLAPEHEALGEIATEEQRHAVDAYREAAGRKSDLDRADLSKEKTGVFTGAYATNPVNGERIPIWIADYVLGGYGTGAIMAVPAHDARDLEFARTFDLPIKIVVEAPNGEESLGFTGTGVNIHSDFLNGLATPDAKRTIIEWLEERGAGERKIQFKLRDWLFSRQRYWGEPFPIVWTEAGHWAIDASELPLVPPEMDDYKPTESGEPPLARAKDWVAAPGGATRETNTMPQWAGSCWYFLRYLDPHNSESFCSLEAQRYWMGDERTGGTGVDLYVGGAEHAVLHLLYARFWHKALYDLGHVSTPEPFHRLVNQGLILGEDGQKMSKSIGNVINPDEILSEFGADAFRLYEMFMGPLELVKPWNTKGVEGVYRFLGRVWRLFIGDENDESWRDARTQDSAAALSAIPLSSQVVDREPNEAQWKALHGCIQKVTDDIENLRLNTAISAMMIFVNEAIGWDEKPKSVLREFLTLLAPFAPHFAEELYEKLGPEDASKDPQTIAYRAWPVHDPNALVESTMEIPVQVNGKLRDRIEIPADIGKDELEKRALASDRIREFIGETPVRKVIVVPGKMVNIVAK